MRLSGPLLARLALIRDALLPELRNRFLGLEEGEPPGPVATFRAPHPGIGRVTVTDDGDEATVSAGRTHGHFDGWERGLTIAERESRIVEDVVEFLSALFADEIVVWEAERQDGWYWIEGDGKPIELPPGAVGYTWSGPYEPPSG